MDDLVPILLGLFVLAAGATALALRNPVHTALCLVPTWVGLAAIYLWAGAEFVAFAQVLVYVGAVSIVVLFAVLLTRRDGAVEGERASPMRPRRALLGVLVAAGVGGVLAYSILNTELGAGDPAVSETSRTSVRELGERLVGADVVALLAVGVLLTVALLGGVVLAAREGREDGA
jgi:NADH:ubiquinone oxidoreductase subunit 6 (subunit J)